MTDQYKNKCYKATEKIINIIADKQYELLKELVDVKPYILAEIKKAIEKSFRKYNFETFDKYEFEHIEEAIGSYTFEIKYQLTHCNLPSGIFIVLRFDLSEFETRTPVMNYSLGMPSTQKKQIAKKTDIARKTAEKKLIGILKDILRAMHSQQFNEIPKFITDTKTGSMDELEGFLVEFVQGTVNANDMKKIDLYSKDNYCNFDEDEGEFSIEYILSADGGEELPLCMYLTISGDKIVMDIQPD